MNRPIDLIPVVLLAMLGGCASGRSYVRFWEAPDRPDQVERPIAALTLSEDGRSEASVQSVMVNYFWH